MNKEEFKKITEYLDKMVILHQTTGETINKDLDISIKLSVAYEELEQQNQKYKEVIDKVNKKLNNFIECCKAEKLESGSDYLHHQYWDMFERFNKQIKDILKEME